MSDPAEKSDDLVDRLAEVSHATWMLQSVRDYGKSLSDLQIPRAPDFDRTEQWRADVEEAERILAAVRDRGESLEALSPLQRSHHVTCHDRERAAAILAALERLGIVRS
jgi:hypothetical protein